MLTLLVLGANARDTMRLRLGAEAREIRHELQAAGVGETFRVTTELAVRPSDLQKLLLVYSPTIVHFISGHGLDPDGGTTSRSATTDGGTAREFLIAEDAVEDQRQRILRENDQGAAMAVRPDVLTASMEVVQRDAPRRCVLLNACFTASQARAIAEHIDCVIGTTRDIDDLTAIAFATAFYRAIAHGKSVGTAFDLGRIEIGLRGLPGEGVFRLFHRRQVEPEHVFLSEVVPPERLRQPEDRSGEKLYRTSGATRNTGCLRRS